ncbi:MAG: MBL fold metallo-hydrolase [Acidilobaceae archaeon]
MSSGNIRVLGSGREVGRAAILVESSGGSILLDYGVNFDERDNPIFPEHVRPRDLSALILTHSHLDHVGAAPMLYISSGPPLYATSLTLDVSRLLLYDMIKLSGPNLPFDESIVAEMIARGTHLNYGEIVEVSDFKFKLLPSGHIPGSASVLIEARDKTILYTSDVNVMETKLMRPAELRDLEANIVIIESTYGSTNHPPRVETESRFYESIREVVEGNGVVLIPAFSVSRGQEILCILAERDPGWPIWVDGMIRDVAELYLQNPGYIRMYGLLVKAMREFNIVRGWHDRKMAYKESGVIIASSGMLKGGPSLYYLRKIADNPRNALFLVSFQGRGTPGRQILETGFALQEEIPIRARVEWFDFSSHIDQRGILELLKNVKNIEKVILVHGVPKAQSILASKITEEFGFEVLNPGVGESISF